MADAALSAKSAATTLAGTEKIYAVQGGTTVYATPAQFKTYIIGPGSISVASGKTLTVSNSVTLTATDGSTLAIGAGGTLGTAAYTAASAYEVAGAAAAAQAASQPLDSDLTAIAALTTTSYGRALLALADAAAGRTALGIATTGAPRLATPSYSAGITQSITDIDQINVGTLTGNLALTLSGGVDGQAVRIRFKQDGTGSRLLTLDSKFRLNADITAVTLSTAINKIDYLGVIYHATDDKYDVVAFTKGF